MTRPTRFSEAAAPRPTGPAIVPAGLAFLMFLLFLLFLLVAPAGPAFPALPAFPAVSAFRTESPLPVVLSPVVLPPTSLATPAAQAAQARQVTELLLRIDCQNLDSLRILGGIAPPTRVTDGYALAWGDSRSVSEILALGFRVQNLGPRIADRLYAVVYLPAAPPMPALETLGRVLARGPCSVVLEYAEDEGDKLCGSYSILPILDRPIRFAPGRSRPRPEPEPGPDPAISDYVAAVDSTRLTGMIQLLQDYGSRRTQEAGCFSAADTIAHLFRATGLTDVSLLDYQSGWSPNVVAVQRGTLFPEEIYLIGGHYDSISRSVPAPGADDNASGTAAVMEAARLFGRESFEATVIYAAFSGEEQGLFGSEQWALAAAQAGLDLRGVVNLDMIGWRGRPGPPDMDIIADSRSLDLLNQARVAVAQYLPNFAVVDGAFSGGNSDEQSFWDNGYPALTFHEHSDNPYWHTSGDLLGVSVNDFGLLTQSVRAAVAVLASWARPVTLRITHLPLQDPPAQAEGYTIRARIRGRVPVLAESLLVGYAVDEIEQVPLRMAAISDSGDYAATIPRQDPGRSIEYEIRARDMDGQRAVYPSVAGEGRIRLVVGRESVLADDFGRDLGWTVGAATDDAATGIWGRVHAAGTGPLPGPSSPADTSQMIFMTGTIAPMGDPGQNDVDGGRTTLTSPRIDLAGAYKIEVTFRLWYVDETVNDDTLRISLSDDDGVTWIPIMGVHHSARSWKFIRLDDVEKLLAPTAQMRIRFVAEDVERPSLVIAALAGFELHAVRTRAESPMVIRTEILEIRPNPFHRETRIVYRTTTTARLSFAVHDAAGRRVAHWESVPAGRGEQEVSWLGRDDGGRLLPSGIYFLRLTEPGGGSSLARLLSIR